MPNALDDEQLKREIQKAINTTKDFEEPYRSKAFEIILSKALNQPQLTKKQRLPALEKPPMDAAGLQAKILAFSQNCNLTNVQLRNVFEFDENEPIFIVPLVTGTLPEKQSLVSRLLLAAYEDVYEQKWLTLAQIIDANGICSKNLSRALGRQDSVFCKKGEKGQRQYKLADSAKAETYQIINQIANRTQLNTEKENQQKKPNKELITQKI